MRKWIVDCWNAVMDHNLNPLSNIPDLHVRHMIMQVLAFMWSAVFALQTVNVMLNFTISSIAHILFLGAVVITVGTFKVAEKRPYMFGSYHSVGRQRGYIWARNKQGKMYKIALPAGDPGGEHE